MQGDYTSKFRKIDLVLHGFPRGLIYKVNGQPENTSEKTNAETLAFNNLNGKITVSW